MAASDASSSRQLSSLQHPDRLGPAICRLGCAISGMGRGTARA